MKTNVIFVLTFLLLLLFSINLEADPNINCPDEEINWSQITEHESNFDYLPGRASVSYRSGIHNGVYMIKVDWNTFSKNNSPSISYDTWKKILTFDIIKRVVNYQSFEPGTIFNVEFYYTRECTTKAQIVLNLDVQESVYCCPGNSPVVNEIREIHEGQITHKVYSIYKDVICGYKCCKKVYVCKVIYDPVYNIKDIQINSITPYSVTSCSGPSNNIDCITGLPTPCIDGTCD